MIVEAAMNLGDLVRNLNSESGLLGIVTGWKCTKTKTPVVLWADGRVNWIMPHSVKVVLKNE